MTLKSGQNSTSTNSQAPKRKIWIYLIIGIIGIMGSAYYSLLNQNSASINHDFYRVLYEASNTFNENLNSLVRMRQSEESEVSIRSLLPSYTRQTKVKPNETKVPITYQLSQQKIIITHQNFTASIDLQDLLPTTTQGFSQYLFADIDGSASMLKGQFKE